MLFFGLMAKSDGYYGYSRDFAAPDILCRVIDCPANSGHGRCISPASIKINSAGVCEFSIKVKEDQKKI